MPRDLICWIADTISEQTPKAMGILSELAKCTRALFTAPIDPHEIVDGDLLEVTRTAKGRSRRISLTVNGNMTIRSVQRSRPLPKSTTVHGSLTIQGCHRVLSLGTNLVVDGDLTIIGCKSLVRLPPATRVGGKITLLGCPSFTGFHQDLDATGDYVVRGCNSFQALGVTEIHGSVHLEDCPLLASLPTDLVIHGNLKLVYLHMLTTLPRLTLHGQLSAYWCENLGSLHDESKVMGGVKAYGTPFYPLDCPGVSGNVYLEGEHPHLIEQFVDELNSPPEKVKARKILIADTAFRFYLRDNKLAVEGTLNMYTNTFAALQDVIEVSEDLNIVDWSASPGNYRLPVRMRIWGGCSLNGIQWTTSLPSNFFVCEDLVIASPTTLQVAPSHVNVAGKVMHLT
mmetsp:Transcript_9394/g.17308  ORF Transcript_9394/g.17308 Transcript_9394/m.17308 type:complete len:398 (-) Transcript_9394:172-1365(-)